MNISKFQESSICSSKNWNDFVLTIRYSVKADALRHRLYKHEFAPFSGWKIVIAFTLFAVY